MRRWGLLGLVALSWGTSSLADDPSEDASSDCDPKCRSGFTCREGKCVRTQCTPRCRSGFVCREGQCISACNPACADHEQCTEEGECRPKLTEERWTEKPRRKPKTDESSTEDKPEKSDDSEKEPEERNKRYGKVRVGVGAGGGAAIVSSPAVGTYNAGIWSIPAFNGAFRLGYQFHRNGGVYYNQTIIAGGDNTWSSIVVSEHVLVELDLYGYLGFAAIGPGVATTITQVGSTKGAEPANFSLLIRGGWNIPLEDAKQPHHFFTISMEVPFVFYAQGFAFVPSLTIGWDHL